MALLRVDGLSSTRTPLRLEAAPPDDLRGTEVAVIGYPAEDFRNDHDLQQRIFRGKFRIKRMQPGKITGTRQSDSFGHPVKAMTHDSSTLGGNSGSAIVNVKTGHVLGLHFGGVYLSANYAVPSYELSRDPFVIGKRVQFTRENLGVLPWKSFWDQTATESKPVVPKADGTVQPPPTSGSSVTITIPLQITVSLGTIDGGGRSIQLPVAKPPTGDADDALADVLAAEALPYYDAVADTADRESYFQAIDPDTVTFEELTDLLVSTHTTTPAYKPARWVYPVVDRQKNKKIRSLYSVNGTSFTFQEMIALDEKVAAAREERIASGQESLEDIEAALPFNCEHVVPQSWFSAKEPMRGDIHHLFGCESRCNSFRSNNAFFAFDDEAVRPDCGQSASNKFEPGAGKGAVARATFYFLVCYPKKVRTASMPAARLAVLKEWHAADPVSEWEKHRNQAIFRIQGNRNPFIDFPELGDRLDLKKGLRTGAGESVAESETESYGEVLRRE